MGTTTAASKLSVDGNLQIAGPSRYLNFGYQTGTSSYGIRDYNGTIQVKSASGIWSPSRQQTAGTNGSR